MENLVTLLSRSPLWKNPPPSSQKSTKLDFHGRKCGNDTAAQEMMHDLYFSKLENLIYFEHFLGFRSGADRQQPSLKRVTKNFTLYRGRERKHMVSGGGCEREEEKVCLFDKFKCDRVSILRHSLFRLTTPSQFLSLETETGTVLDHYSYLICSRHTVSTSPHHHTSVSYTH